MKKRTIILAIIIVLQLFLITMYIYQQSCITTATYQKQEQEKKLAKLAMKKQELLCKLSVLQDRATIKTYAETHLDMKPVSLHTIKKIPKKVST